MSDSTSYRPKFGFDIRIRPPSDDDDAKAEKKFEKTCEWPGCELEGSHKAPKNRTSEGEYSWFCLAHVREYNRNWNFFSGMSAEEAKQWREAGEHGHRPTWKFGTLGSAGEGTKINRGDPGFTNARVRTGKSKPRPRKPSERTTRSLTTRQRKAFDVFQMPYTATKQEVRDQYKALVKRFHPDANGGDRSFEARLREVIEAYQVLKTSGFC